MGITRALHIAVVLLLLGVVACSNPLGMANTNKASYTVSYSGNGSTGGTIPSDGNSYVVGATVTVASGKPTKTGYSFTTWNTASDGSGSSYSAGTSFNMGAGNVVLYAQWSANPAYGVTYVGNGATSGSVPVDSGSYTLGTTVSVLDNTGGLTLSGFSFVGWNTASDGSGSAYLAGSTLTMGSGALTLYAQWTSNPTYTVSYSANGATSGGVPTDTNHYLANTVVTVRSNAGGLAKSGYTFAGWNTASDGTGTSYAVGSSFTMGSANITLYALWTNQPTYTITYNANNASGGSVPTDSNNYLAGALATILGNSGSLTRSGYAFCGWNTKASGGGASYTPGTTLFVGNGNLTLYAQWSNLTYTVTYIGNGASSGSVPTDSGAYSFGATVTVLGNTGSLARTGYSFAGWNTASDGSGTSYAAGATFTMAGSSLNLYALWTANNYTVSYNANGGSGTTAATAYTYGNAVTLAANGFSYAGYSFAGWNTAANGSGTSYTAGTAYSLGASNLTLYAQWTNSSTVTITGPSALANYTVTVNGSTALSFGSTCTYSATYTGTAAGYQWYFDGVAVAGASGSTWSLSPTVSTVTYGQHVLMLTITDTNGLGYSGSLTIHVTN